jgi:hypothetical protein
LKWQRGGCYASWCETGWYSSPAIVDIDGDGIGEVVASGYSIVALEGADGQLVWRAPSGHDSAHPGDSSVGRTWPGIGVADVDGDGVLEIVTAHGGGWVSVYQLNGLFEPGWPVQPVPAAGGAPISNELRSLSLGDLDNDGALEIVVGAARGSSENTWVFEHTGSTRSGWPQVGAGGNGAAWGVYGATTAIADLNGDTFPDIVVPSDVHYVCAYAANGSPLAAGGSYAPREWGEVGVWVNEFYDNQGWGPCDGTPVEGWRTNFNNGPATVADLDHDGSREVVITGDTYDCGQNPYLSLFHGVYVFNGDRTRWAPGGGIDWMTVPTGMGAPLSQDYNVIESAQPAPAIADLDGDHHSEILYSDYAGKIHAFTATGVELAGWPVSVYAPAAGYYRFASEPTAADLDGDGDDEVIVATWTQKTSGAPGTLLIIDGDGTVLHSVDIPLGPGTPTWGGSLAAPTLGDIDGDRGLEVVLQTSSAGVVAFDLPGTDSVRVAWPTGRGSYRRDGVADPVVFRDGFERGNLGAWTSGS